MYKRQEEENERLYELWITQQEMCEETCDFHVENMDEDNHDYDYSAQEEMLEDRDETYEKFIALEYVYRMEEKTARTGYILHGHHSDDQEIETITISAAENGGSARKAETAVSYTHLDVYKRQVAYIYGRYHVMNQMPELLLPYKLSMEAGRVTPVSLLHRPGAWADSVAIEMQDIESGMIRLTLDDRAITLSLIHI